MSVPFLKKGKGGYRLLFSKALYPRQALLQLKDRYSDSSITVSEKGKYFELQCGALTEEECLAVCESFLYFAKNAIRT